MRLVILTRSLIFCINHYKLIYKFQRFVKLLRIISANTKLSTLETLLKPGLFLMKSVLKPLAKSILLPLGLTAAAAAAATDSGMQIKFFASAMTRLKIANKKMDDIVKIIKPLVY